MARRGAARALFRNLDNFMMKFVNTLKLTTVFEQFVPEWKTWMSLDVLNLNGSYDFVFSETKTGDYQLLDVFRLF